MTEVPKNVDTAGGPLSKLKFPELPVKLAIGIPLAVLLVALLIIGYTYLTVQSPLHLGLDFKGGTLVTIKTDKSDDQLKTEFAGYPLDLITRDPNGGAMLRFSDMNACSDKTSISPANI